MRTIACCFALCLVCVAQDTATFTTDVKVVNLLANVIDKHGAIINGLKLDDFAVFEDGRPQTVRYFARQSDLPLTLGLMVDTSMSQERVLDAERAASFRFLDQVLRENKDKVFIMQFDLAVLMRQELTASYKDLNEALSEVSTPTRRELNNGGDRGTLLYDAVIKASKDIMQSQRGRKALILLTDGEDNGSDATQAEAIDAAQRADTVVYSILFSGGGSAGYGRRVLENISKDTGGGFFEVSKKQSIDQIFDIIQNELRSQYSLGYVSDQVSTVGQFRKIQLKVSGDGLRVQARDRYWAQP